MFLNTFSDYLNSKSNTIFINCFLQILFQLYYHVKIMKLPTANRLIRSHIVIFIIDKERDKGTNQKHCVILVKVLFLIVTAGTIKYHNMSANCTFLKKPF